MTERFIDGLLWCDFQRVDGIQASHVLIVAGRLMPTLLSCIMAPCTAGRPNAQFV